MNHIPARLRAQAGRKLRPARNAAWRDNFVRGIWMRPAYFNLPRFIPHKNAMPASVLPAGSRLFQLHFNQRGVKMTFERTGWIPNPSLKNMRLLFALILLHLAFGLRAAGQSYVIDWYKISGGGGASTGGVYAVSGTIGQPDAGGAAGGGQYSVTRRLLEPDCRGADARRAHVDHHLFRQQTSSCPGRRPPRALPCNRTAVWTRPVGPPPATPSAATAPP